MRSSRARCLLAVVVVLAAATDAAVASDLTLSARDVPGLKPAGTGKKVALRAVGGTAPRSLVRASAQGAAFATGKRRLSVGVFTLASRKRANRALQQAGRGARRLTGVADAARTRTRVRRRMTQAVVVLRAGRVVAAVRLDAPGRVRARSGIAVRAYARALAAKLRRVLSRTAWDRTLDGIRADGSFSAATALRAFAIAYGPLPGVKRPTGRLGGPDSATVAIRMVARKWRQLTPAQRAAVNRALGPRHSGASAGAPAHAAEPKLMPAPKYNAIASKYAAYFSSKLPGTGEVTIKIFKISEEITDPPNPRKAFADAQSVNAAGEWGEGDPAYCRVRVPPHGQKEEGKTLFELIMAHEVFHCFQYALMDAWRERGLWLLEGTAMWAALEAYTKAPRSDWADRYEPYLTAPEEPLFSRSYDAMGFWGRVAEVGGTESLWGNMPAILDALDDEASFHLAGGTADAFLDTWASSTFRYPKAGASWYQQSPSTPPYTQLAPPATPVLGDATLESKPYSLRQYRVVMDAARPLVRVVGTKGSVRAGTPDHDFGKVQEKWFCNGDCTCPSGKGSVTVPHEKVGGSVSLGLTGGGRAGAAQVSFHTLDDFCKASNVQVSGATTMAFTKPALCIAIDGKLRVTLSTNPGVPEQPFVGIVINGYGGKGSYGVGGDRVEIMVADLTRPVTAQRTWYTPVSGKVTVSNAGVGYGRQARGKIDATVHYVDPSGFDPPSSVHVAGDWRCRDLPRPSAQ